MSEKNNLKAFEILKFIGIIAMVLAHCFIFLYRIYPEYGEIQKLNFINRFAYFNGLYSMTLPALAGVYFYEKIKNHIRGQYLTNIDLTKLFKPVGVLFIMESFKNALIFGWESFFRWDVLHFVSVSLILLTLILIKWGIRSLFFILMISLFLVSILSYFDLTRIVYHQNWQSFLTSYLFGCLVFCIMTYIVLVNLIKLDKTISLTVFSILILVLSINSWQPELNTILSNYPLSVFAQLGQNGGHIWPLFPWVNCLFVGFLLARYLTEARIVIWQSFLLTCIFQIPIIYFLFFHLESYQELLSKHDFFTSLFFRPHWLLFVILNVFFIAAALTFDLMFKIKNFSVEKISQLNQYILPIYFIHLGVAWNIAGPLIQLFSVETLKWLYPLLVIFLTYCFIQLFLLASDKMIWFRLKKTTKR